jgi:hypothetical protein
MPPCGGHTSIKTFPSSTTVGLAVEFEDGERQIVPLDLEHSSNVNVGAIRAESIAPAIALRRGPKYFGFIPADRL